MEGCHNDGNPLNNRLENLRWDTHLENCRDTIRHGRSVQKNRERCPRGHLLVEPNIIASRREQGHRGCLACDRAKAAISITNWKESGQPCPYSFEKLTDAYYAKIMGLPLPDPSIQLPVAHKDRTHCLRDHLLVEPNLVLSALKKNKRKRICLACQRAHSAKSNAIGRGEFPPDFIESADRYYAKIMGVANS